MVILGSKGLGGLKREAFKVQESIVYCGAKFSALESCRFFSMASFGFWIWMEIRELR